MKTFIKILLVTVIHLLIILLAILLFRYNAEKRIIRIKDIKTVEQLHDLCEKFPLPEASISAEVLEGTISSEATSSATE